MVSEGARRFLNLRYFLLTLVWFFLWTTIAGTVEGLHSGWVRFGIYFLAAAVWPALYIHLIEPRLRRWRRQS